MIGFVNIVKQLMLKTSIKRNQVYAKVNIFLLYYKYRMQKEKWYYLINDSLRKELKLYGLI